MVTLLPCNKGVLSLLPLQIDVSAPWTETQLQNIQQGEKFLDLWRLG